MWPILGILAVTVVIIFVEVPALLKKKLKKELWVFFMLLTFGVGVSIAQSLGVKLPNPLDFIKFIYQPLSDFIENLFK